MILQNCFYSLGANKNAVQNFSPDEKSAQAKLIVTRMLTVNFAGSLRAG
jgi:hypothetical protein